MTTFHYNDSISILLNDAHLVGCTESAAKAPRNVRRGPGLICLRRHLLSGTLLCAPRQPAISIGAANSASWSDTAI